MDNRKFNAAVAGKASQVIYSTTDGRQRFPDILQVSYGEKAVIGFDRYGRALGAVVPMEAVLMLAGKTSAVDKDVMARIERSAQKLLDEVENMGDEIVELDDIKAKRKTGKNDLEDLPASRRNARRA